MFTSGVLGGGRVSFDVVVAGVWGPFGEIVKISSP